MLIYTAFRQEKMLICYMAIIRPDIERFRLETDGVKGRIHFNNAGSSLPPNIVRDAMIDYLKEEAEMGGYEYHRLRTEDLEELYANVAQMINAKRDEIAILENATAAWNAAFLSFPLEDGDEVITNSCDYASNYLAYLNHYKKLVVKVIPDLENGDPDLEALEKMFTAKTKLVAITHMPTNGGLVSPIEEIGAITKKHDVLYLIDACQSVGQYPIDVEKIQCDFLSATGRKYLRAPRGTGFLYARKEALAKVKPHIVDLHGAEWTGEASYVIRPDARQYEIWEGNRGAQIGLKAAVDYANEIGLEAIWGRVQYLGNKLREAMSDIPNITLRDKGSVKGGIVSFNHAKYGAVELQELLFQRNINISWNGAANTYLDMTARGLKEISRASVHYYNTEEEIDQFVKVLEDLV